MKVDAAGQIAIPPPLREKYGLEPSTEVELVESDGGLFLRRADQQDEPSSNESIDDWLRRVQGSATAGLTTDEIMAMTRGED